jgi:ketol-acid reductoisomerase
MSIRPRSTAQIEPKHAGKGAALAFAHGFNIHYGRSSRAPTST